MIKFKIGTMCAFVILFSACKEKECVELTLNKDNGKIIKQKIDLCNQNKIIYEQEFLDSSDSLIPNGYAKYNYDNGKMKLLSFYKNGIQDSISLKYYKSGVLKEEKYLTNGTPFGPQYTFLPNGNIEEVDFYTQFGKSWLKIKLNDSGQFEEIKGRLLHITLSDKSTNFDSLSAKSTLYVINEVPIIQKKKTILNIKVKKEGKVVYDQTFTDFTNFYRINVNGFKYTFQEKGAYLYLPTVSIVDSISGRKISTDSFIQKIKIY
jgi:hypothetical protein